MTTTSIHTPIHTLTAELRERRAARAQHRRLRHELATYRTRAEVDDLLAALTGQEGPEVEEIRDILSMNLQRNTTLRLAC